MHVLHIGRRNPIFLGKSRLPSFFHQGALGKPSKLPDSVDPDFRNVPDHVRGYGEQFGTLTLYVRTMLRSVRTPYERFWPKSLVTECTRRELLVAYMFL